MPVISESDIMQAKSSPGSFFMRGIPPDLHETWRKVAEAKGLSMNKMAQLAILSYCKHFLETRYHVATNA